MIEMLKNLLRILAYWFDPEARRRREIDRLMREVASLEDAYAKALADGDPEEVGRLGEEMRRLRNRIRKLEGKDE